MREHSPPIAKIVDSAKKDVFIWGGGVIFSAPSPDRIFCQTTRKGWKLEEKKGKTPENCNECLKDGQFIEREKNMIRTKAVFVVLKFPSSNLLL